MCVGLVTRMGTYPMTVGQLRPQHFLYFLPEPQGCFGIRCEEFLPGCRSRFDRLLDADDPELPKNVVMPLVDREQRAVAIRALVQCPGDAIVMLHHETENAVHMIKAMKAGSSPSFPKRQAAIRWA